MQHERFTIPITIAVIDDHFVSLAHFVEILKGDSGFEVVGAVSDGQQGRELIRAVAADIYLLSLESPEISGLELLSDISQYRPLANTMMISIFDDDAHIVSAIDNGATGYLLKDTKPDVILAALRDLHAGGAPLSPAIAKKVLSMLRSRSNKNDGSKDERVPPLFQQHGEMLTEREIQVLRQLAIGLAFREIAGNLSISSHTVAQHVRNIYRKLAVRSRGKAVYQATKLGILGE